MSVTMTTEKRRSSYFTPIKIFAPGPITMMLPCALHPQCCREKYCLQVCEVGDLWPENVLRINDTV